MTAEQACKKRKRLTWVQKGQGVHHLLNSAVTRVPRAAGLETKVHLTYINRVGATICGNVAQIL